MLMLGFQRMSERVAMEDGGEERGKDEEKEEEEEEGTSERSQLAVTSVEKGVVKSKVTSNSHSLHLPYSASAT